MHLSSCGTFLIANVLSIFFLFAFFFSGVDAQHNSDLLPRCPSGFRSTEPWWHPLRSSKEHHDPCNLFKSIRDRDTFAVTCCFADADQNIAKRGDDENKPCGPCNLQTYNLASACKACESFSSNSVPGQEDVAQSIREFPSFTSWKANEDITQSHGFETLPAWTNASVTPGDVFDLNQVLLVANNSDSPSPDPSDSPSNTAPVTPGATGTVNSPSSPRPSGGSSASPGDSLMKQGSSKMQAGAVAGGVIGGIVFMAILLLGMIYLIRSRRARHGASPTAFASVSGPGASPTKDLEGAPPLETKSSWRPFPLEKWPSTASGTSQHGLMSNVSPWGRDIEKY